MAITLWRRLLAVSMVGAGLLAAGSAHADAVKSRWQHLDPFVFGEGSQEVVIFTAPSCPFCRQLVDHLPALAEDYRVVVLPISFISHDAQRIRLMACAEDAEAAARAYLLHQDVMLPQKDNCDLSGVKARFEEAKSQGVSMVPFIIRPDGQISRGLRPDLLDWLAQGTKR
ncbi:MAG: thioredoxin fold domain-containing protein [Geminicoccaceae bacterium]